MFREVRDDVIAATNGNQTPFVYGSRGSNDFYFMPGGTVVNNNVARRRPPSHPRSIPRRWNLSFWNSASTSNDPSQLQAYLDSYPNGTFASLARAKMISLEKMASLEKPPERTPSAPAEAPAPAEGTNHFDGAWNTICFV